jgi:hypothetical protein
MFAKSELEATENERRTHPYPSVNIDGKKAWSSWTEPRLRRDPPAAAWRRKRCDFFHTSTSGPGASDFSASAEQQRKTNNYRQSISIVLFSQPKKKKKLPLGPLGHCNRPAIIRI